MQITNSLALLALGGAASAAHLGARDWSSDSWSSTSTSATYAVATSTSASDPASSTSSGCTNGPDSRDCWYGDFSVYTDNEVYWPTTGNTVYYNLDITNVTFAPDGTPKEMLVFNNQYPGPLIECNWGDNLEITVTNSMAENGTGIHWHGLRQYYTNDQDGVNGITECPLAPGDSKVYKFQATDYGTTWYHSHFSAQYGAGVLGPMVIHGPASADYDEELGTIIVNENYNGTVYQEDYAAERTGPPTASNYLLNGQNVKPDGSAGERTTWTITPGKKYLLRFINTSVDNHFKVAIDDHIMTVISTDFVPINPYNASIININIGQRYDVVVEFNQPVSSYWLRAIVQSCSKNQNDGLGQIANGIIYYEGSDFSLPTTNYSSFTNVCEDEPSSSLVPVVSKSADSADFAAKASTLPVVLNRVTIANESIVRWTLNNISQNIDWSDPTLAQVAAGATTFPSEWDVIQLPNANVWTYWIIQNEFVVPHPMHLHGHNFYLLGQGNGTFGSNDTYLLNFDNPPRRDVATLPASGWEVIAFPTDNPGAWLMHCHIAWHVGEGLSLQFLERQADIPSYMGNDTQFKDTCSNWDSYFATEYYNKTDSGLKVRSEQQPEDLFKVAHEAEVKREIDSLSSRALHMRQHTQRGRRSIGHFGRSL